MFPVPVCPQQKVAVTSRIQASQPFCVMGTTVSDGESVFKLNLLRGTAGALIVRTHTFRRCAARPYFPHVMSLNVTVSAVRWPGAAYPPKGGTSSGPLAQRRPG